MEIKEEKFIFDFYRVVCRLCISATQYMLYTLYNITNTQVFSKSLVLLLALFVQCCYVVAVAMIIAWQRQFGRTNFCRFHILFRPSVHRIQITFFFAIIKC